MCAVFLFYFSMFFSFLSPSSPHLPSPMLSIITFPCAPWLHCVTRTTKTLEMAYDSVHVKRKLLIYDFSAGVYVRITCSYSSRCDFERGIKISFLHSHSKFISQPVTAVCVHHIDQTKIQHAFQNLSLSHINFGVHLNNSVLRLSNLTPHKKKPLVVYLIRNPNPLHRGKPDGPSTSFSLGISIRRAAIVIPFHRNGICDLPSCIFHASEY